MLAAAVDTPATYQRLEALFQVERARAAATLQDLQRQHQLALAAAVEKVEGMGREGRGSRAVVKDALAPR